MLELDAGGGEALDTLLQELKGQVGLVPGQTTLVKITRKKLRNENNQQKIMNIEQ